MTIAMCYVAPEGIVLGADSTASATPGAGQFHFYNHNQKLFEIGEGTSLGLLTWGLGGFPNLSFRTLAARLGDGFSKKSPKTVEEAAERWADLIWKVYSTVLVVQRTRAQALAAKTPYDPSAVPPAANSRTESEENEFNSLMVDFHLGFCVAGYCEPDREPQAYAVVFSPADTAKPIPDRVNSGRNFGERLCS